MRSINPRIGVLPPGPITNTDLINPHENPDSQHYIKQGLVLDTDYKMIRAGVWKELQR
jgi:hypothetical protein